MADDTQGVKSCDSENTMPGQMASDQAHRSIGFHVSIRYFRASITGAGVTAATTTRYAVSQRVFGHMVNMAGSVAEVRMACMNFNHPLLSIATRAGSQWQHPPLPFFN